MSHSTLFNDAQQRHLALAEADVRALHRQLRPYRAGLGLSHLDWLTAAALATSVADQLDQVVALADHPSTVTSWAQAARRVRDTAARHELAAALADTICAHLAALRGGRRLGGAA